MKQENDVVTQTSPGKGTSPQESGSDVEQFLENPTRNTAEWCLNDSKKRQPEIKEINTDLTANYSGDDSSPSPKITNPQFEERLVREEIIKELYISFSFAICRSGFREQLNNRCSTGLRNLFTATARMIWTESNNKTVAKS